MPSHRSIFARRRAVLEDEIGRELSRWELAALLDCSERHVLALMQRDDEEIRPAWPLALEYARTAGLDACRWIVEQRPEEFASTLYDLTLDVCEVARRLGVDASTLRRYTQPDRELDVPRHYYLALLYLHQLYGKGAEPLAVCRHVETYADE